MAAEVQTNGAGAEFCHIAQPYLVRRPSIVIGAFFPKCLRYRLLQRLRRWPRAARMLGFAKRRKRTLKASIFLVLHALGIFFSYKALHDTRTPQGTVAWVVSLNTMPVVAVPAYMLFGGADFEGYVETRAKGVAELRPMADKWLEGVRAATPPEEKTAPILRTLSQISYLPVTDGNQAELLVDGDSTYKSIFAELEKAEDYILLQFYTIRADSVGEDLKERLINRAQAGVRVHVLYDDVGSLGIDDSFAEELRDAGVKVATFMKPGIRPGKFRLNYRNHRKLVVVDGKVGFVGGHNLGEEYLGKHPVFTPWRDCHMRLTGPIVPTLQVPFLEDWKWSTDEVIEDIRWDLADVDSKANMQAVAVATGPTDDVETCGLLFQAAVHSAQDRIWIATPYFVPDESLVRALQLAAKRGVEVKILIPKVADSKLTTLSAYSYLEELDLENLSIYRYEAGFIHQKVLLVDDDFTVIGSANMDNRSIRLNFELVVGVVDKGFTSEVAEMLRQDFLKSSLFSPVHLEEKSLWFRTKVRFSRLLAPIQ